MQEFDQSLLKNLYIPKSSSHKGENGKVLVVGGSTLFHAASLWTLQIASKIVDMVFYSSVHGNNEIIQKAKKEFRNGIVVSRRKIYDYAGEADSIVIGPGMVRTGIIIATEIDIINSLKDVEKFSDNEGEETYFLTGFLMKKYPHKRWVFDAGAIQMMNPHWLKSLKKTPILTPHHQEFARIFKNEAGIMNQESWEDKVSAAAKQFDCVILLKGEVDIVASPNMSIKISGGNAGMTKGGTGDVLAGLTAALYAQNDDPFLAACAASYINKKAGESLFEKVGYYFNASDLVEEIPKVMKELIL